MNELDNKTKTTSMTVRLNLDVSDKFKTFAKEKNISQGEFIEELMKFYENRASGGDLQALEPTSNDLITLLLKYNNTFENKTVATKKIIFKGTIIYKIPIAKLITIRGKEVLKKEFEIPWDIENFNCSYWWGVAEEFEKNRYIIYENFYMEGQKQEVLLNVKRCKVAKDLDEILLAIKDYALEMDTEQLEYMLSETIITEEELMNYFN